MARKSAPAKKSAKRPSKLKAFLQLHKVGVISFSVVGLAVIAIGLPFIHADTALNPYPTICKYTYWQAKVYSPAKESYNFYVQTNLQVEYDSGTGVFCHYARNQVTVWFAPNTGCRDFQAEIFHYYSPTYSTYISGSHVHNYYCTWGWHYFTSPPVYVNGGWTVYGVAWPTAFAGTLLAQTSNYAVPY